MPSKTDVEMMMLSDLTALCDKLAKERVVPKKWKGEALTLVEEHNSLLPDRGEVPGSSSQHFEAEKLLVRITRFLPAVFRELDDELEAE